MATKAVFRHINQPYWGGGDRQLHSRRFHQCLEVSNDSKTPNVHLVGCPILQPCGSQTRLHAVGPDLTWFWLQGTWTATTRITNPVAARLKLASQPLPLKRDHPLACPRGWPCTLFLFPASQSSLHPAHKDGSYPLLCWYIFKESSPS